MRWRLSLLMFLQYAPAGAVLPPFSLHLHRLGFSPAELAWVCATPALGSLVGPLVVGQIADRWVAAERCLLACAAASDDLRGGMTKLLVEGAGRAPLASAACATQSG